MEITDMQYGYHTVLEWILECGEHAAPRGMNTKEILDASIVLTDPTRGLPIYCGRKVDSHIAAAEALQVIGGFSDPRLLPDSFDDFKDGGIFHGAYGPRTRMQMPTIIRRLSQDRDTRQAVVTVWDPLHDCQDGLKDYPCTVALQFIIRKDKLQLHTHMRSNDAWRGLAYDVFQFTQLQLAVAAVLGILPGPYHHHATSLHLYEADWEKAEICRTSKVTEDWRHLGVVNYEGVVTAREYDTDDGIWRDLQDVLKIHDTTSSLLDVDGFAWYEKVLIR